VEGVGGVIYSMRGQIILTFSWSLGVATNNHTEACTLYKGLSLAKSQGIKYISIIKDSWVIINQARKISPPQDMKLNSIIVRVLKEVEDFRTLHCYHVL
jgi:ribonuclease HI